MNRLDQRIRHCRKCRLWRTQAVPGEGPPDAEIMLIGQNPGKEEEKTGRPFVGQAGKYLDQVLERNNLSRDKLFITSVVKHKTPGNRKPRPDEIQACMPFLTEQINLVKPKIIVLMGEVARKGPRFKGIRYMESYHPAAAMRFPKFRRKFEGDFRKLAAVAGSLGISIK